MKLLCTPKRIITRSIIEVAPMCLVVVEKLDERLEEILRSRGPVTVNLKDFKFAQIDSDPSGTASSQRHPPPRPKKITVKEEPREAFGDETETEEPVELRDDVVEDTIAPVQIKQERSPSPEVDRRLIPCGVDTMVERRPMARRKPEGFPSGVKKRKKCDPVEDDTQLDPEWVPSENLVPVTRCRSLVVLRSQRKTPGL